MLPDYGSSGIAGLGGAYGGMMIPGLGGGTGSAIQALNQQSLQRKAVGDQNSIAKRQLQLQLASTIINGILGQGGLAGLFSQRGGGR